MDLRQYAAKYPKPDHVREGPIPSRVVNVFEDERYGRPTLELENGMQFSLNESNLNALMKAWGCNSDDWIGLELALELGAYKDWKSKEEKETVKVRAISPAKTAEAQNGGAPASRPLPPSMVVTSPKDDMDDSIPF